MSVYDKHLWYESVRQLGELLTSICFVAARVRFPFAILLLAGSDFYFSVLAILFIID